MMFDNTIEFYTNFNSIISTLEEINEKDSIHGSDASSVLKSIQDFELVFCLKLIKQVLQLTNSLSLHFQKKKPITQLLGF